MAWRDEIRGTYRFARSLALPEALPRVVITSLALRSILKRCAQLVGCTSTNQECAEVAPREAENVTKRRVDAIFDAETSRPVSLERSLTAAKLKPKADIFWRPEFLDSDGSERQSLLAVSAVGKSFILPTRIEDPTSPYRKGKVAVARPLFGATCMRFSVLPANSTALTQPFGVFFLLTRQQQAA